MWPDAHDILKSPNSLFRWVENHQTWIFTSGPSAWRKIPNAFGDISVVDRDDTVNDYEAGYILSKDYWGRGPFYRSFESYWTISCKTVIQSCHSKICNSQSSFGACKLWLRLAWATKVLSVRLYCIKDKFDFSVYGILKIRFRKRLRLFCSAFTCTSF